MQVALKYHVFLHVHWYWWTSKTCVFRHFNWHEIEQICLRLATNTYTHMLTLEPIFCYFSIICLVEVLTINQYGNMWILECRKAACSSNSTTTTTTISSFFSPLPPPTRLIQTHFCLFLPFSSCFYFKIWPNISNHSSEIHVFIYRKGRTKKRYEEKWIDNKEIDTQLLCKTEQLRFQDSSIPKMNDSLSS